MRNLKLINLKRYKKTKGNLIMMIIKLKNHKLKIKKQLKRMINKPKNQLSNLNQLNKQNKQKNQLNHHQHRIKKEKRLKNRKNHETKIHYNYIEISQNN